MFCCYSYLFYNTVLMCGIFFSLSLQDVNINLSDKQRRNLSRRGPDRNKKEVLLDNGCNINFESWVLHMRGQQVVSQPLISDSGNILSWNGEIFGNLDVRQEENDTTVLAHALDKCQSSQEIIETISGIRGPFAIVYYCSNSKRLYFGRDYFGRRSLLISLNEQCICLASVANRNQEDGNKFDWQELPCIGIFYIDIYVWKQNRHINCVPWISLTQHDLKIKDVPKQCTINTNHPISIFNKNIRDINDFNLSNNNKTTCPDDLALHLNDAVQSVLSALPFKSPNTELLDLLKLYCDSVNLWPYCTKLLDHLKQAVQKRVYFRSYTGKDTTVGVLFSGGIDCTVIALLTDMFVSKYQSIDLLNVAFQQKKHMCASDEIFNVPDRQTGIQSYLELKKLCPNRKWNFIKVDTKIEDLQNERKTHITDLTYPKTTVLDDSIACAIWFASRGAGLIHENSTDDTYTSTAKILLCGMGADEQLGGYSRHRGIFEKMNCSWEHLTEEMDMEIERIGNRNLGRDDRIISDHGKEGRFPYLDEGVVEFLHSLPTYRKTDPRLPRGIGEKVILRGVAYLLGLRDAAVYPKRAIQFGSRIAKAEGKKEKGGDVCKRLI